MFRKYFTLIVLLLVACATWGQSDAGPGTYATNNDGDGRQVGPTWNFQDPGAQVYVLFQFGGLGQHDVMWAQLNQILSYPPANPTLAPQAPKTTQIRTYIHGIGTFAWAMRGIMLANAAQNMRDAPNGTLAPLQYFMGPSDVEMYIPESANWLTPLLEGEEGSIPVRIGKLGSWSGWPDFGRLSGSELRTTVNNLLELKTGYGIYEEVPPGALNPQQADIFRRANAAALRSVEVQRWMNETKLFGTGGGLLKLTPDQIFRAQMLEDTTMREIGDELLEMPDAHMH